MSKTDKKKRFINPVSRISSRFALFISGVTLGASLITVLVGHLIITLGVLRFPKDGGILPPIVTFLVTSAFLVILFSCIFGRKVFKTILEVSGAMQKVAGGDFSVRVRSHVKSSEFSKMADSFNFMTAELEKKETLAEDFISNVSHEFKTPLAAIQNCCSLLDDPSLSDEERHEYGTMLRESADHLLGMCTNILHLSKLENSFCITDRERFSLDEQIRRSILLLEKRWSEKEIELDIDLESTIVSASKNLLSLVLVNIIGNAIKFSEKGSSVAINLKKSSGFAIVEVVDSGIGMSKETLEKIFEKFYQGDSSHKSEGNGLGLPLAKRIIDLHGGEISVRSSEGVGSVFTVKLPLTP